MPFTTPPSATNGSLIASAHVNTLRDNDNWFDGLLSSPTSPGQVPISSGTTSATYGYLDNPSFNANAIGSLQLSTLTIGSVQIGTAQITGTLLASTVSLRLIADGILAWFRTAAEIASGWTRETAANDRYIVGVGTLFGGTFAQSTNYGTLWSHLHGINQTSSVYENNSPDLEYDSRFTGGAAYPIHQHYVVGNTDDTSWMPPSRGYIVARKG